METQVYTNMHRCQNITLTNDGLLSIEPKGTYFNKILFELQKFSFKNMDLQIISHLLSASIS